MSKTVDERVVEMRFDNKDFESNVKTSMSTLERLKSALKLDGVTKGLDGLSKSAKKVDMSGLSNGIETVNARFSAMQVVGMTALSNITTAAMRAGTNMVKAFTIDPITSGFREYETQLNSIQTILANTKSKGTTIDDVTAALDELNKYADQTIYNFTEMTKNIGTFTAAGVDLDTSVGAIKGIANLGAMSSSTSAQVSTAMYQLSQALATGRVSLMDWNSVVNAGMGGEQFQNALKRTAEHFGTDVDGMIKKYGSFRESLTQGGWLTAEVLTETLNQIGGAYDETALKAQGWSDAQIAEILDLAKTAGDAATDVTSFTKLVDTLKESVGSGWANVWSNIFGDINQAKTFFTGMKDLIEPFVTGPVNALNSVLEQTMNMGGGSRWSEFTAELDKAGVSVDAFQKKLSEVASGQGVDLSKLIEEYGSLEKAIASGDIAAGMISDTFKQLSVSTDNVAQSTKSLAEWQKVVDDVWLGVYGNVDTGRIEKLTAAGWEFADVQKLVNMTVDGHRLSLEDLSAAQIVSMGYTQEQADALVELAKEAEAAGTPLNTLINDILSPKKSGRELLLGGFENILKAILNPLKAVSAAFSEVFAVDPQGLYNALEAFNRFTEALVQDQDTLDNITSTFKGLFGAIKIFTTLIGGGFSIAFRALTVLLENFDLNILDVTAAVGEAVYAFSEWLTSGQIFSDVIGGIVTLLTGSSGAISGFFNSFMNLAPIQTATTAVSEFFNGAISYVTELTKMKPADAIKKIFNDIVKVFKNAYNSLKSIKWENVLDALSSFGDKVREVFEDLKTKFEEMGPDILEGLQNGLKEGISKVVEFIRDMASKIIEAAKAVLGIHSPSTVFFEIGKNIIEGLCNGIKFLSGQVRDTLLAIIGDIKSVFAEVDWGAVLAVGAGVGTFIVFYQLTDALQTFATGVKQFSAPFQSAAKIFDTTNNFLQKLTEGNSSNKGFANIAQGLKLMAEAVAILVGSIAVLAVLDPSKMWQAVAVIGALAAILGGLAIALNKFAADGKILQSINLNSTFLSLAASFAILAVAARILGSMEWGDLGKAGAALLAFGVVVGALVGISHFGNEIDGVAKVLSKIGIAFLLLSVTAKLLGGMTSGEMINAGIMLAGFTGVVAALVAVSYIGKDVDNVAKVLSKVGTAFLLLAATAKILGGMTTGEMINAGIMLAAFTGVVAALIAVTQIGDKSIDNVTEFLGKVGIAFLALAVSARLLGGMTIDQMQTAGVALAGLTAVIAALVAITRLAPKGEIAQISATLLAMSASIAILAAVAVLLGYVKTENLAKGLVAVGFLSAFVAGMTAATRGARDVKNTMVGIAIAIGTLAAAVAVLSFIDPGRLAGATAAIGVLMGMLAVVLKAAPATNKAMSTIVAITVFMGLVSAALFILAGLPTESVMGSAVALSATLIALAAACKILSTIEGISKSALAAVGVLTAVMAALAIIFGVMSALGVEASIPTAIALSVALNAMAAACLILDQVQGVAPSALAAMGVLTAVMAGLAIIFGVMSGLGVEASLPNAIALSLVLNAMAAACLILDQVQGVAPSALAAMGVLTAVMAGLAIIFGLMAAFDVQASLPNALALSTVMLAMAGVTAILSAIGPLAAGAIAAAGSMAAVIAIIAGVVAAAGAIKQIPGVEWLVSEGASFLQSIGEAIGGFVGGFVGGALEGLSDSLPGIADNLSNFMVRLTPFLMGLKMLDPSAQESITALTTMIGTLTGAGLMDSITSFITGESSLTKFAEQLVPFGEAIMAYSQTVSGIDAGAIQASATAGQALSELANSLPKEGGLAQAIFGENQDFASFGLQLVAFGTAIKAYSIAIEGINTDAIQASATAGQALSELANNLPKEGGLAQAIFGENQDLGSFGTQLVQFGLALKMYSMAVDGLNVESIQNSVAAGQALKDLQNGLGSDGGVLAFFTGDDMNLGDFASNLTRFGEALSKYSDKVSGIDVEQIKSSTNAVRSIITTLKSNADSADSIGSGIENIKKIKDVGEALNAYSTKISGVDVGQISNSANAIQNLISTITSMVGIDTSGVATFKQAIEELSTVSLSGIVDNFNTAASQMVQAGANIMNNLASGLQSGQGAVTGAVQTVVVSMAQTVASTYPAFVTGGNTISTSLAQGVTSGGSAVSTALTSVLASAAGSIRGYYSSFYSAGAYITQGLANGMNSMLGRVRSAATQIANEAARATRAASQVKSPSRVFMKIGGYMGEGLVIGLDTYQSRVYDSGYAVGDKAAEGLNRAIDQVSKLSLDNMDLNPTITPVIDLTNVKNGVASIDNMLSKSTPMDVMANVGSIDRAMNARLQNGVNDDVVSAIDRLRRGLDNVGNTTYQIDGITYDDGSAIAGAVGQLVRAARIGRRA